MPGPTETRVENSCCCRLVTPVEVPQSGYHVLKGTMNNYNVMVRGILVNNDCGGYRERVRKLRIYP